MMAAVVAIAIIVVDFEHPRKLLFYTVFVVYFCMTIY